MPLFLRDDEVADMAEELARLIRARSKLVDDLLSELGTEEIAISSEIGDMALDAAVTYGKAVGHPADLNFGDCFAYGCAKVHRMGLVSKGDDFAQTDLA